MLEKTTALVCIALGAMLSTARADDGDAGSKPASAAPAADGADQLTLPKGRAIIDAYLGIGLSNGAAFKPISISPDVWYGATDELTVGLVHSAVGATGFIGGVGTSLCLSGTGSGCGKLYPNVGIDARYKLKTGQLAYAIDGGLYALTIDPFAIAVKLGVSARWHQDKLAVELQPNLFIGVTNRTTASGVAGAGDVTTNGERLNLPVTGLYTVAPNIDVAVQLGLVLPFEAIGDNYAVPLSIGGSYHVNESLNVNAAFTLLKLIGGGSGAGIDGRSLTLGGTYAF
jgi:hypothetical protein